MDYEPHDTISNDDELEGIVLRHEPLLQDSETELTAELAGLISALKEALSTPDFNSELLRQLWTEYSLEFEKLAGRAGSQDAYTRTQIDAIIHKALIFRDTGKDLRCLEELNKAEMYAANEGLNALNDILAAEIDSKTRELEPSPERLILQLRGRISDSNQAFLWDLWADEQDYDDLKNHAYGMLLSEGLDPEDVLEELGILEP